VSYPRRRARPNEETIRTISEEISEETSEETSDEAGATEGFDLVDKKSYADAWSLWLDHTH
jgi:hypothetical protein